MKVTLKRIAQMAALIIACNLVAGWVIFVQVENIPLPDALIAHFSSFTGLGLDTQNLTILGRTYATIDSALGFLSIPVASALIAYRIAVSNLEKLVDSYLINKRKIPPDVVKEIGPMLVDFLQEDPSKILRAIQMSNELVKSNSSKPESSSSKT
jgi:hypothetical protein